MIQGHLRLAGVYFLVQRSDPVPDRRASNASTPLFLSEEGRGGMSSSPAKEEVYRTEVKILGATLVIKLY